MTDIALVVEAFLHFEGLRRIHAVALVLAFSPNTVAAVAASCVVEATAGFRSERGESMGVLSGVSLD
ncbi:unnamed protein product [Effrenium voratum]|uniref:Uncharacterized protein n=1 Tax=Effrenium voratum TaxID=2562239 RepID=A0AA36I2M5_9DINO|nr:unnamed protein product [Effrenium voratum]